MSYLKVKASRYQKMFGEMRNAGDDLTAFFNPTNPDHMHMIATGDMVLTKEETPKRATKRKTASK